MQGSLMRKTRHLLRNCGKSLAEVHVELRKEDIDISYYWLRKFSSGEVQDPSVNTVQRLYEHLTGHSLTV